MPRWKIWNGNAMRLNLLHLISLQTDVQQRRPPNKMVDLCVVNLRGDDNLCGGLYNETIDPVSLAVGMVYLPSNWLISVEVIRRIN